MSSNNTEIVVCSAYKTYKGYKYHLNFPNEWILNEEENTGRDCNNCVDKTNTGYAMWRGIILGYCANCCQFNYEGTRGIGFMGRAVEVECSRDILGKSVFKTYLKDINLEEVGDISENPEDTIENRLIMKDNQFKYCIRCGEEEGEYNGYCYDCILYRTTLYSP